MPIAYHPSNALTYQLSDFDQPFMRHIRQLGPVAYRMALCCGLDQSPDPCRACAEWRGFRPPYQRLPSLALFAATREAQWRDWECPTPPLIILGAAFHGGFQFGCVRPFAFRPNRISGFAMNRVVAHFQHRLIHA